MDILPASLRDLSSLYQLEHASFPDDAWPLLDLIAVLTYPGVVRLKAVVDGRMVGFIAGDPRPAQGMVWIATLAVLPAFRRRGIAKALLEVCEAHLHLPCIRLCVRTSNRAAIHLYQQMGYSIIDTWQRYYKDGESAVVMEKIK